jgi:tRNA nucleotidyltransferase (CCA-adding enzyme)
VTRLEPPAGVLEIAEALERAGYETWCVGGAVRDALLGHPHLDWDLATAATPAEVREVFGKRRTIPKGIKYGTVAVLDRAGRPHEVTTFRRDVETDGRHAVVAYGASLDEDLARRDFTINAIAYSPSTGQLRDPFGGRADLERGVIRAVGDPDARMREDRLRALRALRFAARFGFAIEPGTWRAIVASAPALSRLSADRVHEELRKTMEQVARPSLALSRWRESGALATLVPPLAALDDDSLAALDCLPPPGPPRTSAQRTKNRLAALFLPMEPRAARDVLRALRFSNADADWIAALVERWHALGDTIARRLSLGEPTDAELRRWVAGAGRTRVASFLRLAAARWAAARARGGAAPSAAAVRALYRRALRTAFGHPSVPLELADLAVDGDDLRAAGIPAGPLMRRILLALLDVVLDDPAANARDRLLAEAVTLYARWGAAEPPPGAAHD